MKFEEHEGQLFRMMEEPVPCQGQLKWNYIAGIVHDKPLLIRDIPKIVNPRTSIKTLNDLSKVKYVVHYDMPVEIIGYPVEEGSAEWALYQMMQGEKVVKDGDGENGGSFYKNRLFYLNGSGCLVTQNAIGLIDPCSEEEFLDLDKTGWQLYEPEPEPKPLLADAKVGDLCQRSNGRYTQFHSKHKLNDGTIAYYFDDISGSTNIDGDHCPHECGNNIVSCEPLAPIGSAEWALQMMKLGKDVCRKGQETAYYHICNDGKEIACSLKNEIRLTCGHLLVSKWGETGNDWQLYEPKIEPPKEPDYVICKRCGGSKSIANPAVSNTSYTTCPKCGGTGYEISEPKPESENIIHGHVTADMRLKYIDLGIYKVGDWVTDGVVVGHVVVINNGKAWVKTKDAHYHLSVEHIRKLKPSEVVLDFGIGIKGTVRSCEHDGGCVRVISGDRVIAHIMTDVLEQPTRNLVRQLLKAQEEKC